MSEELIYRRDCNLFTEPLDCEETIHNLMVKYRLDYDSFEPATFISDKIFDFARELLQKAQNVIDSANTIAYEKDFINCLGESTTYLSYDKGEEE